MDWRYLSRTLVYVCTAIHFESFARWQPDMTPKTTKRGREMGIKGNDDITGRKTEEDARGRWRHFCVQWRTRARESSVWEMGVGVIESAENDAANVGAWSRMGRKNERWVQGTKILTVMGKKCSRKWHERWNHRLWGREKCNNKCIFLQASLIDVLGCWNISCK